MMEKILTFVVSDKKFLALRNNPHPKHGGDFWFVVTGGVKENETHEEAVAREILEETGLIAEEIIPLNWGSIYEWRGEECKEYNFISFVKPGNVSLNEEHIEYKWLNLGDFIERIKWDDNKNLLRNILIKALNKEQYFKKQEIKDYRKNEKKI